MQFPTASTESQSRIWVRRRRDRWQWNRQGVFAEEQDVEGQVYRIDNDEKYDNMRADRDTEDVWSCRTIDFRRKYCKMVCTSMQRIWGSS